MKVFRIIRWDWRLFYHLKNGYDLTINKYKEVEYEKIEYPPTSEIIAEIKKLDREASESLAKLEKLLNETNPDL